MEKVFSYTKYREWADKYGDILINAGKYDGLSKQYLIDVANIHPLPEWISDDCLMAFRCGDWVKVTCYDPDEVEYLIICRVQQDTYCLINPVEGNRWEEPHNIISDTMSKRYFEKVFGLDDTYLIKDWEYIYKEDLRCVDVFGGK